MERIRVIDSLRGFTLLGVLIANIPIAPSISPGDFDTSLMFFSNLMISRKFIAIFSMLFGYGFYTQFSNYKRDEKFINYFIIRMLFLMTIGVIHSYLIWNGDIIMTYALCGVILIGVRNWSVKKLNIFSAFLIIIVTGGLFIANDALGWQVYNYDYKLNDEFPLTKSLYRYLEINLIMNPWSNFFKDLPITLSYSMGNMLLGVALGKLNFFIHEKFKKSNLKFIIASGVIGFISSYIYHLVISGQIELGMNLIWLPFLIAGGMVVHSFFYILLFKALFFYKPLRFVYTCFEYVGKLSLTNYLTQSILYIIVFYHFSDTFNLFGKLSIGETFVLALLFFGFQILFSSLWLRRFKKGPVEFLWRKLTEFFFSKVSNKKTATLN